MSDDLRALLLWVTDTKKDWKVEYAKSIKTAWSDEQKSGLRDEMTGVEIAFDEVIFKLKVMLRTSEGDCRDVAV